MKNKSPFDPEKLVAHLQARYVVDPATGNIISKRKKRAVGYFPATAGYYRMTVRMDGLVKKVNCHIVVWCLTYGVYPAESIDHINRNRRDNRPANLRLAGHQVNALNKDRPNGLPNYICQGAKGLCLNPRAGSWRKVWLGSRAAAERWSALAVAHVLDGTPFEVPKLARDICLSHLPDLPFQVGLNEAARYFPTLELARAHRQHLKHAKPITTGDFKSTTKKTSKTSKTNKSGKYDQAA